jgi:hypothetical protein
MCIKDRVLARVARTEHPTLSLLLVYSSLLGYPS